MEEKKDEKQKHTKKKTQKKRPEGSETWRKNHLSLTGGHCSGVPREHARLEPRLPAPGAAPYNTSSEVQKKRRKKKEDRRKKKKKKET